MKECYPTVVMCDQSMKIVMVHSAQFSHHSINKTSKPYLHTKGNCMSSPMAWADMIAATSPAQLRCNRFVLPITAILATIWLMLCGKPLSKQMLASIKQHEHIVSRKNGRWARPLYVRSFIRINSLLPTLEIVVAIDCAMAQSHSLRPTTTG